MSDIARVVGAIALAGCLIGLSGCDWWPPALQQQIGELDAKVKAVEAEKSAVLKKMADVSQAAEDCRVKSDQMAKSQADRSEEHTSELQSPCNLVCRLLL